MAFATWDATRKGAGVTLTGGNLIATMSGGLYMVAATDPLDISTAQGYYAEFAIDSGSTFIGFGLVKAGSLTDQYLGAYNDQLSLWQDGSFDKQSAGITVAGNRMSYTAGDVIKAYVVNNKIYLGKVGVGWWNPPGNNFTGSPTSELASGFSAGNWSLGTSTINDGKCTGNFGASSFTDTPPSGAIGWPAGGSPTAALTGQSETASAGTLKGLIAKALSGQAETESAGTVKGKITKALTGAAETTAAGTVKGKITKALGGQQVTMQQGTLSTGQIRLTGIQITDSAGTLRAGLTKALTGQAATESAGTVKGSTSKALAGQQVVDSAGTVKARLVKALTGLAVTVSQGTLTPHKGTVVALTGIQISVLAGTLRAKVSKPLTGMSVQMFQGTITTSGGGGGGGRVYPNTNQTKATNMRQLVAAIDGNVKEPITVYEFSNGRRFTEGQDDPY